MREEIQMGPTTKQNLIEEILSLADRLFRQLLPSIPKELLALDVTMPQAKIMIVLYIRGAMRMSDIASELEVALPTATSFIDRLVEKKYVLREPQQDDRRVVLCRLSKSGQKAISRIWDSGRERSKEILEEMDAQKLQKFAEVLEDMLKSANIKTGQYQEADKTSSLK
jgi:DNA-binding MarR family transcriptional regulator